jgi:hypothetical protein
MLALKLQMLVNNPEESIQHSEHDESLKSGSIKVIFYKASSDKVYM